MQFCDSYFFLGNINGGYRKPIGRSFIAIETEDEIRERMLYGFFYFSSECRITSL